MLGSTSLRHVVVGLSLAALAFGAAACRKSEENKPAATDVVAAVDADGGADSGVDASTGPAASYSGSYTVSPGTYYIPSSPAWSRVKPAKDDAGAYVGEGAMTLTVDDDGRVTGAIESGPVGPAVIEGSLIDGELRGFIRRRDPSDQGLTGTFTATVSGGAVAGTLALAEATAAAVREGKLTLEKK